MRPTIRCSILVTILALTAPASAQETTRLPDETRQSVGLDTGLEHAFIARGTYAHRLDLGFWKDVRLFGRFTLPFVTPDLGDWAIDGGLRATPIAWGDLRLALLAGPVLRNTVNNSFSSTSLGVGTTALFGYEGARWGLSAEAGYEQMLTTNLRHSDVYRNTVYAGAKDGWYALSGSTARGGLRGGVRFDALEIFARAGVNTTGQLHADNPPFYVTLGTSYAF
jgi:hypothetical protein